MRDDTAWLLDICDAIDSIEEQATRGRTAFDTDRMVQVWMVHHIQVIGEAANGLSEPLRARYPQVPWADVVGMRNVLVHHYFGIDLDEVWDTISHDLPSLKKAVQQMLEDEQR